MGTWSVKRATTDASTIPPPGVAHMAATAIGGRELSVVNAVADLVRTHITAGETTIHAYLRLNGTP